MSDQHSEQQHSEQQNVEHQATAEAVAAAGDDTLARGEDGHGHDHGHDHGLGEQATGDIVIDSALQDLQDAPADDLDATIEAGQRVHQTLQARLSDLGGE